MNWKISWILLCWVALAGCSGSPRKSPSVDRTTAEPLSYAKGFRILDMPDGKLLRVYGIGADSLNYREFKLVSNSTQKLNPGEIRIPCQRIICLSSTQLTYFLALDALDPIVGVNSSRHLFHQGMKARIASGLVKRVGKEGNFDTELIAALNPDVIFVSPFKTGGYDVLKSLGFNLVPLSAYNEHTPLGRAEWVKFIGAFLGKEAMADSVFQALEQRYRALCELTAGVEHRPTVFSGKMRSGTWYVPGGQSFYARFFRDAGADYVFHDSRTAASPLDFETVYQKAARCDFWRLILTQPGYDLNALQQEDERYTHFKAFETKQIVACNITEKPYYEEAPMKPDVILADFIHCFHPDLLPDYQPVFFDRLQAAAHENH